MLYNNIIYVFFCFNPCRVLQLFEFKGYTWVLKWSNINRIYNITIFDSRPSRTTWIFMCRRLYYIVLIRPGQVLSLANIYHNNIRIMIILLILCANRSCSIDRVNREPFDLHNAVATISATGPPRRYSL